MTTDLKEYLHLVLARYAIIAVETYEEIRFTQYAHTIFHGRDIFRWSLSEGLIQEILKDGDLEEVPFKQTDDYLASLLWIKSAVNKEPERRMIFLMRDFHPAFENPSLRRHLRDLANILPQTLSTIFMVSPQFKIPVDLEKAITLVDFPLPTEADMISIVKASAYKNRATLKGKEYPDSRIREIARSCLGLTAYESDTVIAKSLTKHKDFVLREIADEKKQIIRKSGVLEIYDPDVKLQDLGGMEILKQYLAEVTIQADDPKARAFGLPSPKGILLLSPPGNGKSALAKAIAFERNLTLVKFDFGAMLGSLLGESEGNMRKAFARIESINRCVVWMDEIEKAFPSKDAGSGDGGAAKRMLGMALTFMQERKGEGYIVATANGIQNLPPEMLRAGRFDSIWFIDLPTAEQRLKILEIHLQKRGRDCSDWEGLPNVAERMEGYSGAEIEQAVINGLRIAFYKKRAMDSDALLDDISEAIGQMKPLSETMKEDIDYLREWAGNRAQMASRVQVQKRSLSTTRRV